MQEIDEWHGPQMKIALFKASGKDILCVIMNHMICDAAGFKEVLYRPASLYTALETGTAVKNGSIDAAHKKSFPSYYESVEIIIKSREYQTI